MCFCDVTKKKIRRNPRGNEMKGIFAIKVKMIMWKSVGKMFTPQFKKQ